MPTRQELQAKSEATRLKNLLTKKADKKPFTKFDESVLKRLQAKLRAS